MRLLRASALVAVLASAVGSLGLMLYSGRNAPRFLVVLFTIWVMCPFFALVAAHVVSTRWPLRVRTALHSVMLVVAVGSLAIYVADIVWPPRSQAAFVYVLVPPVSFVASVIVVAVAALLSGKRSSLDGRV